MFGDGIGNNFTVLCHGIHFHFLGMFDELADNNRMFLRYISRKLQETFQFFLVGADVHCRTGKHIRRTHQHRETYFFHKFVNIVHARKFAPARLIYADTVQHG